MGRYFHWHVWRWVAIANCVQQQLAGHEPLWLKEHFLVLEGNDFAQQEQLERPETRGTFSAVCVHLTHVKDYQYWSYKVLCFTVYSSPSTVAWRLAKESVAHVCTNSRDLGLGIQSMKCTLKTAVNSTNMVSISCRMLPMKYKLSAPTKCETWLIPGIKDLVDYFYQE